jgi:hypothetical protein
VAGGSFQVGRKSSALILLGLGLVLLAGCGGEPVVIESNVVPTRTLVPPTATPDSRDVTPTPTNLPDPESLVPNLAEINLPAGSPETQAIIDRARTALIDEYEVNADDVQLLGLDRFTWYDESLGCPARYEEGYTQATTSRGYRVIFSADGQVYVFHTSSQGVFFRCEDDNWLAVEGDPLPTDPIAESLVDLTQQDAAAQVAASGSSPRLTSLIAVSWPDSSLGCPRADGTYETRTTPGYRIIFRVGGDAVIYHTSISDFVRCTPEEEILPGILRSPLAEQ